MTREDFVRELADALPVRAMAQSVLDDVGYPRALMPNWDAFPTSLIYWNAVVVEIEKGVLPKGGIERLAAAALNQYQGNLVFREMAGREEAIELARRQAFIAELAGVLGDPPIAHGVLEDVGYPRDRVPAWGAFRTPWEYWTEVVAHIENGVLSEGGIERLAAVARNQYPGNPVFREAAEGVPDLKAGVPELLGLGTGKRTGASEKIRPREGTERWPTLIFRGADQYDGFLRIARQYGGPDASLLYTAAQEAAILLPGRRADDSDHEVLMSAIRRAVDALALPEDSQVQVAFREYQFRPQAIERLRLLGPDQSSYIAENVPNTTPIRDVARAVLSMYSSPSPQGEFGGPRHRRIVVDRIIAGAGAGQISPDQRLDPNLTLAEAGILTDDELRVTPESTAGGGTIPPGWTDGGQASGDEFHGLWVFLCHSSGDKPQVRQLYCRLKGDGLRPWLDEEDILPGADWQREVSKAISRSDLFIVCLSHGSVSRAGYVQREIRIALDMVEEKLDDDIFIVPLRLEQCEVPDRLRKYHWADLYAEGGYDRLIRTARAVAGKRLRLGRVDAKPGPGASWGPVG